MLNLIKLVLFNQLACNINFTFFSCLKSLVREEWFTLCITFDSLVCGHHKIREPLHYVISPYFFFTDREFLPQHERSLGKSLKMQEQ